MTSNNTTPDKNSLAEQNQQDSQANEVIGEGEILKYDEVNKDHIAEEDVPEISSTDDV